MLCVVGPTASGKSELAVKLAKKYNGEIISCDSRQIYKGMDIGTGKVEGKWKKFKGRGKQYAYENIIHHCIDYVSPKKQYSSGQFQKDAHKAIVDILKRGKLPILCGGTGHWVDAVVYGQKIPQVKPNIKLRRSLEKISVEELFEKLKMLDPERAAVIDWHNPRRLIRALEIIFTTGKPVPKLTEKSSQLPTLWLGIYPGQDVLHTNITKRLSTRLKDGMVKEIQKLHRNGLSWKKLESFGLEYKFISLFLQKKLSKQEMFDQLLLAIQHYSKRQMTWFRRNETIVWLQPEMNIHPIIKDFLK